ncbi:MAG: four helix bundle protein [Candidatus Aadella gelida]|nr:four helix bundle protein [Candidatus Aadella gelida]
MQCSFEQLKIYQQSLELADKIYTITKKYPQEETSGPVSHVRRKAVSMSLNRAVEKMQVPVEQTNEINRIKTYYQQ